MRHPNNALPTTTIIPPANPADAAAIPPNIKNDNPVRIAQAACRTTTLSTGRNLRPVIFMFMGTGRETGVRQLLSPDSMASSLPKSRRIIERRTLTHKPMIALSFLH
jgi:hypothetical protein